MPTTLLYLVEFRSSRDFLYQGIQDTLLFIGFNIGFILSVAFASAFQHRTRLGTSSKECANILLLRIVSRATDSTFLSFLIQF